MFLTAFNASVPVEKKKCFCN